MVCPELFYPAMQCNGIGEQSEFLDPAIGRKFFTQHDFTFGVEVYQNQRWSPRGRPWPRGRPRGHILKSLALALASKVKSLALALASKPQVLENWPVLGSRTALFFEQLKFCWKTQETSQKICEHLFCFPHLEHKRSQGEGGRGSAPFPIENSPMTKCDKKA